jgi:hypothetical protein
MTEQKQNVTEVLIIECFSRRQRTRGDREVTGEHLLDVARIALPTGAAATF